MFDREVQRAEFCNLHQPTQSFYTGNKSSSITRVIAHETNKRRHNTSVSSQKKKAIPAIENVQKNIKVPHTASSKDTPTLSLSFCCPASFETKNVHTAFTQMKVFNQNDLTGTTNNYNPWQHSYNFRFLQSFLPTNEPGFEVYYDCHKIDSILFTPTHGSIMTHVFRCQRLSYFRSCTQTSVKTPPHSIQMQHCTTQSLAAAYK